MMSHGTPAAWSVWHYSWATIVVAALVLNVLWPISTGYAVWALSMIAYPLAAAVILVNRPGNRVGRVLAVVAVAAGVIFVGSWVFTTWTTRTWSVYLEAITGMAVPVLFWAVLTLLYIFPTGTITGRFFRSAFIGFSLVVAALDVLAVFNPEPLPVTGRDNPLAGPAWISLLYDTGIVVLLPGLLIGCWAAVSRYRASGFEVRLQLRWFMFGLVAVTCLIAVITFIPQTVSSPWEEISNVAVVVGFWSFPVAIVIAITRYHLYDIDRLVSRTITYALVVALLMATYLGLVTLITWLLPAQDSVAVAASTLSVAALFNPLRKRLQSVVNRRFNRFAYHAEMVSEELARKLREPRPSDQLADLWRTTVEDVLQPSRVGVWLTDGLAGDRKPRPGEGPGS